MSRLLPELGHCGGPPSRSRLRLVDDPGEAPLDVLPDREQTHAGDWAVPPARGYVLVVGVEAEARAHMLLELRDVLPNGTRFVETQETWETLTLAEGSQMVVLVDDLEELSSASLVRLLARRQPTLPVLAVGGASSARSNAASG